MSEKKLFICTTPYYTFEIGEFRDKLECTIPRIGVLGNSEFPHIYLDHKVSSEELEKAVDTITSYLVQNDTNYIEVDLDKRNEILTPTKEMTIEDIEKALGHKVKIVKEKE